jgi:hypothetical protein
MKIAKVFPLGVPTKERKWDLVAWDSMCFTKKSGGLGIKDPLLMGRDLVAKTWWH